MRSIKSVYACSYNWDNTAKINFLFYFFFPQRLMCIKIRFRWVLIFELRWFFSLILLSLYNIHRGKDYTCLLTMRWIKQQFVWMREEKTVKFFFLPPSRSHHHFYVSFASKLYVTSIANFKIIFVIVPIPNLPHTAQPHSYII